MRKWNKLLALVLAMVMVFGLTATAFAAEDEKTDDTKTETTEPVEGEDDKTPAEGEDDKTPAEGEDDKTPAEGEDDKTPAEGEDDKTPAEGEDDKTPAEGEDDKTPAEGEDDKTPAEGEDDKTPAEGEDDKAPVADPYADVAAWAKEAVAAVVEKKLIDMGETGFNPTANMTRADLVVALYRLAGSPANAEDAVNPFEDVADEAAYKDAVIWAKDKGIVAGKSETSFDPTGDVKRQEIAKILFVYAGAKNVEEDNLAAFADVEDIAAWAKDFVNWAVASKLISGNAAGDAVNMDPNGTATRQQVAVILNRYINEILPADDATTPAEGETEGDKAPVEGETEGDKAPAEGETEGDKAPAEGETEGDKAPAEGETEGDKAPAEGEDDKPAEDKK